MTELWLGASDTMEEAKEPGEVEIAPRPRETRQGSGEGWERDEAGVRRGMGERERQESGEGGNWEGEGVRNERGGV